MKILNAIRFTFLFIFLLNPNIVLAQDTSASLLPNAVQQFFDNNGNPLARGTVTTYQPGTTILATTWKDALQLTPNTNPIILDGGGKAIIYAATPIRQVVKDQNNNLIWDAVSTPSGSGFSPTFIGDGQLVGTIKPWAGLIAPNQYAFAFGQELSRVTNNDLFIAITQTFNVTCASGSPTITGIGDTTQIRIGEVVEVSACIISPPTVISKTTNSVTLSANSIVSTSTSARFFPWGNGNGSTTFNVPDLRGSVLAGRNNMGGSASTKITSTFYGTDPNGQGAAGGSQTQNSTISQANLPNVNFAVNIPSGQGSHTHSLTGTSNDMLGIGGGTIVRGSTVNGFGTLYNPTVVANTLPAMTGTAASGGSGTAFANNVIQPTLMINYIIKVLADVPNSSANGVASLGGMTGVIACGNGLVCTGNVVSISSAVPAGTLNQVQYNNGFAFNASANFVFTDPTLTLGKSGTATGQLELAGATSGSVIQQAHSTAGAPVITWGNSTGTPAVVATSPLSLDTTTGVLSCPSCGGASIIVGSTVVSSGTTGRVLFDNGGLLGEYTTIPVGFGGTGAATFTSNLPLLGNGTSALAQGTISGNTTKFATVSGSFTSGNCIKSDASGNLIDNGATCGGGGGGSPGGTSGQVQYNNAGSFGGFTASGDATINTSTGAVAVTKTGGVAFAASATTDTTNASNISSGTLAAARGGAGTITGALKGNGAGVVSQAACADLSNGSASCSTDTTNASNISSGTLNTLRLPSPFTSGTRNGNTSVFATISGSLIAGNCLKSDASGNIIDDGAVCGGGGGGGSPGGTNGQIQYNNLGAFGGFTASGDATITPSTGAVIVTKTNGVSFAASATTDTTNASNISSGTLNTLRLPSPFTSGTVSGNTSVFATTTGTLINTHCVSLDTNFNFVDAGAPCGAGTVTSVGITAGTGITQSGSPITSSGNITVNVDKATTSNAWAATSNKVLTTDILFNGVGALQSLSGTSSVTPDLSLGRNFVFTATSATNFTLNTPTNTHIGDTGCILFFQPASGTPVTITFGTNWVTPSGVSGKALTSTLGALDTVCYLIVNSTPSVLFTLANNWTH